MNSKNKEIVEKLIPNLQFRMAQHERVLASLERLDKYPESEEDYSWRPSNYTPSRKECIEAQEKFWGWLSGYANAIAIIIGCDTGLITHAVDTMLRNSDKPHLLKKQEEIPDDVDSCVGLVPEDMRPAYGRILERMLECAKHDEV